MSGIILTSIVVALVIAVVGSLLSQAYRAITPPQNEQRHKFHNLANANERFLL